MKNILIGFLAGIILLLTIGQASKDDKYEAITKYSSDSSEYSSNWGDNVQLWENSRAWARDDNQFKGSANLKDMYEQGWRVVSVQKTNASAVELQFVWIFERKK